MTAPPVADAPKTMSIRKPLLQAKYILHLTSGRKREIADYHEDGNDYRVQYLSGAYVSYDKKRVELIEDISDRNKR